MIERDLVAALWAEVAAIEPARRCCRIAEHAGLGAAARGRAKTPAIGRLAVRLEDAARDVPFEWATAAAHCRAAHVRGLVLAHGSLSVTAAGTHFELVVPSSELTTVADRFAALGFPARTRIRRGRGVLTWKEADTIIALLRRLGASASVLELETRLLGRTLHGQMNRIVNAEAANVRRAVDAAHRQLEQIDTLERGGGLRRLSQRTRKVVAARRRSPEATFAEIAATIGLSRGQVQRAFYEVEAAVLHQPDAS